MPIQSTYGALPSTTSKVFSVPLPFSSLVHSGAQNTEGAAECIAGHNLIRMFSARLLPNEIICLLKLFYSPWMMFKEIKHLNTESWQPVMYRWSILRYSTKGRTVLLHSTAWANPAGQWRPGPYRCAEPTLTPLCEHIWLDKSLF